jgi:uncharacterized protein (DUF1778 family)
MSKPHPPKSDPPTKPGSLMLRMDEDSKRVLTQAAQLRRISVSDYVRTVIVA